MVLSVHLSTSQSILPLPSAPQQGSGPLPCGLMLSTGGSREWQGQGDWVTWYLFRPLLPGNHSQTSRCKQESCHVHRVCGSGLQTGHGRESVSLQCLGPWVGTLRLGDSTVGPGISPGHLSIGWRGGWLPTNSAGQLQPLCVTSPLTVWWPRRVHFLHGRSGLGERG